MPNRPLPAKIAAYLGPCRANDTDVDKIIEQCSLGKLFGDAHLTDYDPLLVIMSLVGTEVRGLGLLLPSPEGRVLWCRALEELQGSRSLEHNALIPCRSCDQAFEPVVDDTLFALFLDWYSTRSLESALAIHRCPSCGGQIVCKRTERYEGDMHTPEPGSIADDHKWVRELLHLHGW